MKILLLGFAVLYCFCVSGGEATLGLLSSITDRFSCPAEEPLDGHRHTYTIGNTAAAVLSYYGNETLYSVGLNRSLVTKDDPSKWQFPLTLTPDQLNQVTTKTVSCTQQLDTTVIQGYQFNRLTGTNGSYVTPLYDVQGTIAGVALCLNKAEVNYPGRVFREDLSLLFNNLTVNNPDGTQTNFSCIIVYYVPKGIICSTGRSNDKPFDTATEVGFQIAGSNNTFPAPKYISQAVNNATLNYTSNKCFPGMGMHAFWASDTLDQTNCTVIFPIFLLYNYEGYLIGYGLSIVGKVKSTGNYFVENPPTAAVVANVGADKVSKCILKLAEEGSLTTMHFFFTKRPDICLCQCKDKLCLTDYSHIL